MRGIKDQWGIVKERILIREGRRRGGWRVKVKVKVPLRSEMVRSDCDFEPERTSQEVLRLRATAWTV
jgi:hypothetical protein